MRGAEGDLCPYRDHQKIILKTFAQNLKTTIDQLHLAKNRIYRGALKSKTRDEWMHLMEGTDVCFAPVLSFDEAPFRPHFVTRGSFFEADGITQPAPAPRFSRTPPDMPSPPQEAATDVDAALGEWVDEKTLDQIRKSSILS